MPSKRSRKKSSVNKQDKLRKRIKKMKLDESVDSGKQLSKKIVIKYHKKPQLPKNYKTEAWIKLQDAVIAIQNSIPLKCASEELYQIVQNLCEHRMEGDLYNGLRNLYGHYIKESLMIFNKEQDDLMTYIEKFNKWWKEFLKKTLEIRSIFLYLDRMHITKTSMKYMSIYNMALNELKKHVFHNPFIHKRTEEGILMLIREERQGQNVNEDLIEDLVKFYFLLGLFEHFENKYYSETTQFYSEEARTLIEDYNIPQYLKHVNQRLKEEQTRLLHHFNVQTKTRQTTIKIILTQFIENHLKEITNKGFIPLLENNTLEDLSLMYDLYKEVRTCKGDGTSELCSQFGDFIKTRGVNILSEPETQIIPQILNFKTKVNNIIELSFKNDNKFVSILKESFEFFLNRNSNKPAQLLAKFVDLQLKKPIEDSELEELFDDIIIIFRFIYSKDVFEAFYKNDLAKRLLVGKSASVDAEKVMLFKLRQECGGGFTSMLEGMFKDMELSQDINAAFRQHLPNVLEDSISIDLFVNVLTTGYWPSYPIFSITLPPNMSQYQEIFTNFYLSKYSGRKLQWQPKLGHCILQSCFPLGYKELQVSVFQTLVLLLFNTTDCLPYEDIKQCCNIEEKELKATLQSLACGKARVLKKVPKGKEIEETDMFYYNIEFSNKFFRIKINQIQIKETPEEQKRTKSRVVQDRQYQIDAAIVRIMKMKRTLSHSLLMTELYDKLKFPLKPADLKRRIESLIDQEYIERDIENTDRYHYVA